MISQFCIDIPCRCGHTHKVPLDLNGRWGGVCTRLGKADQIQCDATQFTTLMATQTHMEMVVDKVWTIHKADVQKFDMQLCEDCGLVLCDYRKWPRRMRAFGVAWWKPGSLLGLDDVGNSYRAALPLSPLRERRCFVKPM